MTDRSTNEPVHCCEESPTFDGEAYLKFPFDVERRSYRWWDSTLGGVVRLAYAGEREVQGYSGYLFTGEVEPARTGVRQVPGVLVGRKKTPQVLAEEWYSNSGIELVVDRRTGRIINAAIGPKKTLRAPGSKKDAVVLLESGRVEFTRRPSASRSSWRRRTATGWRCSVRPLRPGRRRWAVCSPSRASFSSSGAADRSRTRRTLTW